jgi:hypothetical protein
MSLPDQALRTQGAGGGNMSSGPGVQHRRGAIDAHIATVKAGQDDDSGDSSGE